MAGVDLLPPYAGLLDVSSSVADLSERERPLPGRETLLETEYGRGPLMALVCFVFLENVHLQPGTLLHLRDLKL